VYQVDLCTDGKLKSIQDKINQVIKNFTKIECKRIRNSLRKLGFSMNSKSRIRKFENRVKRQIAANKVTNNNAEIKTSKIQDSKFFKS
jgi:hypothetical protein